MTVVLNRKDGRAFPAFLFRGGTVKTIELVLEDEDYDSVQRAIALRQSWRAMPDFGESNRAGAVLAEICRGWLEFVQGKAELQPDDDE